MYTVINRAEKPGHHGRGDRPPLEVIDHRKKHQERRPYEESYEKLRQQKEALLEAEMKYQKRIRELEKEAADVAKAQEATRTENKSLKNFLQRGPKAASIKKVKLENDNLQEVVRKLHEDNRDLVQLINRMEKRDQDEWQEVFEETRRRQEERYSVFGPFVAGLNGKKSTITLNDPPDKTVNDNYDRELTKLTKQTKALLHKFEQMQRVKRSIDFATVMGPTQKCTTNVVKHRAIGDKLNLDLNKYSARLEELTTKHEKMTDALITSLSEEPEKSSRRPSKQSVISSTDSKQQPRNGQANGTSKLDSNDKQNEMTRGQKDQTEKSEPGVSTTFLTEVPVDKTELNKRALRKNQKDNSVSTSKCQTASSEQKNKQNSHELKNSKPDSSREENQSKDFEHTKKDERVPFQQETNGKQHNSHISNKGTVEETWDHQRLKLKTVEKSARKRPASKSASTIRKKSVETVKIKSESDYYDDDNIIEHVRRENGVNKIEQVTNKPNQTRSPLVYEPLLKQSSANAYGLSKYSKVDGDNTTTTLRLPPSERQGLKLNMNYDTEETPNSTGRYTNGPESVKETKKLLATIEGPDPKNKMLLSNDKVNAGSKSNTSKRGTKSAKSSVKSARTFPRHPPIHKDSIHLERAPNSKAVLNHLKNSTGGSPVEFNERFADRDEEFLLPVPITFREDARTLGRKNIRFVSQTDQMKSEIEHRRGNFYRSYLDEED